MTERLVADTATSRLINWVLGVGSVVTGGLLLWIGSTTHHLATQQAVTGERVQAMQLQQATQAVTAAETSRGIRDVSTRLDRVEVRLEEARRREAARDTARDARDN